jgi:hypothetical protein
MAALTKYPIARLMWFAPLLLVVISVALVRAAGQQRAVAERGQVVTATIDSLSVRERAEITHGTAYLRYTPPGASAPVVRAVELPLSFLKEMEGHEGSEIDIRVMPGDNQIVLGRHERAQWVLTYAFAAMAALGAVVFGALVFGWNRFLNREGDPALRAVNRRAHGQPVIHPN